MKKIFLVLSLLLCISVTYAQSNFIEFKDGKVLNFGDDPITEKNPMFKKSVLKVNGESYEVETIKGYQHNGTYYAQNFGGFFTRVAHGKLNYYRRIDLVTDSRGKTRQVVLAYLQKGENQKWVSFSNNALIRMVGDNKKTKSMAQSFKKSTRLSNIMLISGGLGMFAGAMMIMASNIGESKSTNLTIPGIVLAGAGLGTVVLAYVRKFKTGNNVADIVTYYNKS